MTEPGAHRSTKTLDFIVPPKLKLAAIEGPCKGQTFEAEFRKQYFAAVGRVKKTADVYIKDAAVSEKHAEVAWDGENWTVRDTDSSNGTRVNGQLLQPFRPKALKAGDMVAFGSDTIVTVELQEQTLADMSAEALLRSYLVSQSQMVETARVQAVDDMLKQCRDTLQTLLAPPQLA